MDELINRLSNESVGCHIGHRYVGALTYADDLTLLAPTRSAMQHMLNVCKAFADEHSVIFNSAKSHPIIYRPRRDEGQSVAKPVTLNNKPIHIVQQATHLGTLVGHNAQKDNASRMKRDINVRANTLRCLFGHCSSNVVVALFKSYCTSLYGSPLLDLNDTLEPLIISWKKAIKHLLGLSVRTRTVLIPHLIGLPDLKTVLLSRFFSFFKACANSHNPIVKLCASVATQNLSHSCLARNVRCVAEALHTAPGDVADFDVARSKKIISEMGGTSQVIKCNAQAIFELRDVKLGYLSSILNSIECENLLHELFLCQ
eukprot:GHVO01018025.1.p1 GENE.GHVO01018025.1~~GHVO01018025.1.p1  ORF type:complete len:314 (-),score=-0.06 GHVO01018025.1:64-1005(-)